MLYTIFDLETTGLDVYRDSVIQCACLTVDRNLQKVRAKNYYLYQEGMAWSEAAEAVNHISRDFLAPYAADFDQNLMHIYTILQRGNLIGYNCNRFDIPFISSFLQRAGMPAIEPVRSFDVMLIWQKELGHRIKLTSLTEQLGITEQQVEVLTKLYFGEDVSGAHNAMYDTVATYLCFRKALDRKICSLEG